MILVSNLPETIFKTYLLIFPLSLNEGTFTSLFFSFSTLISLGWAPNNLETMGLDLSSFSLSFFDMQYNSINDSKYLNIGYKDKKIYFYNKTNRNDYIILGGQNKCEQAIERKASRRGRRGCRKNMYVHKVFT